MLAKWYSHLKDKAEQEKFKQMVLGSAKVLDRAHEILYNMVLESGKVSNDDYDSPSWAYKQADRNGYIRGLRDAMKLLEVSDQDKN